MTKPTEQALADVMEELAAVRAELAELRRSAPSFTSAESFTSAGSVNSAESFTSAGSVNSAEVSSAETPIAELHVTSRRRLFALAGGAAAAAVAAGTALSSSPAAAANSDPIDIAEVTSASPGASIQTFLNYEPTTSKGASLAPIQGNGNYFLVSDGASGSAYPAAVGGYAYKNIVNGVYGFSNVAGGTGVVGWATADATSDGVVGVSNAGVAVAGESTSGYDFSARGTGRIFLKEFKPVGPPTAGSFDRGELVRDGVGDFFVCVDPGSPGTWRSLGGKTSAGSLHLLNTPTRVYDSRLPLPGAKLNGVANRVVKVTDAINLTTGAVATANVVPIGATAVLFNLTLDGATGSGFLSVTPGDAATFQASTINWTPNNSILANGSTVRIDATGSLNVWSGGAGTTHFIIDITGYYI